MTIVFNVLVNKMPSRAPKVGLALAPWVVCQQIKLALWLPQESRQVQKMSLWPMTLLHSSTLTGTITRIK